MKSRAVPPRTEVSVRAEKVRRTDLLACAAMLLSVLCAQAAMWSARGGAMYPAAMVFSAIAGLLATWHLAQAGSAPRALAVRAVVLAVKVAASVGVLAACLATNALISLDHSVRHPSTVVAFGAILLLVSVVQTGTVATRRDLALGAPAVCAMLTQAGMAAHDVRPALPTVLSLAAMVMAVALVYRGELLEEATALAHPRDITGPRRGVSFDAVSSFGAVNTAGFWLFGVVVVAAAVFVLLPDSLHLRVTPVAHSSSNQPYSSAGTADPNAHSRAIVDPATGRLDLRVRGALSDEPVFVTDAAAPEYWRGAVYDHYDGVAWTLTGPTAPTGDWTVVSTTGVSSRAGISTQQAPADPDGAAGAAGTSRTDSVQIVSAQVADVVFAPGRATSYTGPGVVSVDVDGNPRLQVPATGAPSSRDYDVTSTLPAVPSGSAGASSALDTTTGPAGDPRWTQLPTDLPKRVTALGVQLAGHATSRSAAVKAVDDYLQANESYDLDAPLPAVGDDVVDDFLFVSHQGFCEQFATAAVVLLRSAGVPARLVTGYAFGDTTSDPGQRIMRGSDAHAWVQVWYPGVGWVSSDPTASAAVTHPGGQAAAATTPAETTAAVAPAVAPSASSPVSPSPSASPSARLSATPSLLRRIGIVAAIAGLVLIVHLAVVSGRRWRGRRAASDRVLTRQAGGGPVLWAYLRLDDALVARGRAAARGETARGLPRRLASMTIEQAGLGQARLAEAIGVLERECYDIEPPTPAAASSAVAVFDALRVAVEASGGSGVGPQRGDGAESIGSLV